MEFPKSTPLIKPHLVGCIVAFIVFALGFITLTTYFSDGDNAEFLILGQYGGIAHPPGYPLLTILLRFFAPMIVNTTAPVWGFSLVMLLFSTVAAFLFFILLCSFRFSVWTSALSTWWVFLALPVWRISNYVEPFSLHLLLLSMVLLGTKKVSEDIGSAVKMCFLGFLWGLSFCNHHTMVFIAPLVIWGLAFLHPEWTKWPKRLIFFVLGFVLGLLPLSYFFFADLQAPWVWGDWEQGQRLWVHIFRQEYGFFNTASAGGEANFMELWGLLRSLPDGLGWPGIGLLALGLGLQCQKGKGFIWGHAYLIALLAYCLGFLGLSNLQTLDHNFTILQRFFGQAYLLFGFFIAYGLDSLARWYQRKSTVPMMQILFSVFLAIQIVQTLPKADRSSDNWIQKHNENILSLVEPGDVLVVRNDVELFGLSYLNQQLNKQAVVLMEGLYELDWCKKKLAKTLGLPRESLPKNLEDLLLQLHETRRIIIVEPRRMNYHLMFPEIWFPIGPVFMIPPKGAPRPSPMELFIWNKNVFEQRFHLPINAGADLQGMVNTGLWKKYGLAWEIICEALGPEDYREKDFACALSKRL